MTNSENNNFQKETHDPSANMRDHFANERTFLAWIRTSIAMMGFGFVIVKFTLFIKQISLSLQKPVLVSSHGYASVIGILLVALGVFIALLSFLRFKRTEQQIINSNYSPSNHVTIILAVSIILIGIFLVIYLWHNI